MTKFITTSMFLFVLLTGAFAQGNLQFNRVVSENTATVVGTNEYETIGTIVIPAGKVLKIESTSLTYIDGTDMNILTNTVYIDRHIAWSGTNKAKLFLPLWLPEGTYNIVTYASTSTPNTQFTYSAIEFNVIP